MGHLQSHLGGITFYLFRQSVLEHMQYRSREDLEYLKVHGLSLKLHMQIHYEELSCGTMERPRGKVAGLRGYGNDTLIGFFLFQLLCSVCLPCCLFRLYMVINEKAT